MELLDSELELGFRELPIDCPFENNSYLIKDIPNSLFLTSNTSQENKKSKFYFKITLFFP